MKRASLLFAVLLASAVFPIDVQACRCKDDGPFLKAAKNAPLVILVHAHAHERTSPTMEADVEEVLKGDFSGKTIVIRGDDGKSCRKPLGALEAHTHWVLALTPADDKSGAWDLSSCGTYSLASDGRSATGRIELDEEGGKAETVSMEELEARLGEANNEH